ncbi:MAG TPA: DegT/DnrJ/EryC1/StrS family aminotransferase [Verrucomicrobiae bacterium]
MQTSSDPSRSCSRRRFIKTGAIVTAGLSAASFGYAAAPTEKLAVSGGPKTVTFPGNRFTELTRWPRYGDAEKKALCDLLDNNAFYAELPAFEKEWQDYTKSPFVRNHINGTSALTSMYFALDLPPGSEIMVPSYTFFATCLAMRFFGCVPVFVDIDPKTACFDLEDAKRKLTPRTRAVVVMHSWGMPCEMDRIAEWTKEKGLILLEDAAHAHGASMQGRKLGTWGAMGIFSFQASKVMPSVEGGMGLYATREYFERATAFGHYDLPGKFPANSPIRPYDGTGFGQKYRMHPFAAAVARQQLRRLDELNAIVRKNVKDLNQHLTQLEGVSEPRERSDQERVYYAANILFLNFKRLGFTRDSLIKALTAEGVSVKFWDYPEQHRLKIYSEAQWWHHAPTVPPSMPGNQWVNANHIMLPLVYGEAPDLNEQYVKAFQKVWAHRKELA